MHKYFKPSYLPELTAIMPLQSEFNDSQTTFFKARYRIDRDKFQSRLAGISDGANPTLSNHIIPMWGSTDLFANTGVLRGSLKLLKEEREPQAGYDVITETYGYAPDTVYKTNGSATVQFAGHTDRENDFSASIYNLSYNYAEGKFSFTTDYKKGDVLIFQRISGSVGTISYNTLYSDSATCDADGECPAPSFTNPTTGGTVSAMDAYKFNRFKIMLLARTIPSRTDTVNVETQTQFFVSKPAIIPRTKLVDSLGNEVWDSTGATLTNLYDSKYCIEDSEIKFDTDLGLWRRTIKLTTWKVF